MKRVRVAKKETEGDTTNGLLFGEDGGCWFVDGGDSLMVRKKDGQLE